MRRLDLGGELRADSGERVRLVAPLLLLRARRHEVMLPRLAGARKQAVRVQQSVSKRPLLYGAVGNDARLGGDRRPHARRAQAALPHLPLRRPDLARDLFILVSDGVHVIDLVDDVAEAARAQQHIDRRRIVRLVDRDQSPVQPLNRERVLLLEGAQLPRLQPVERLNLLEARPVQAEVVLERR